ncbi:hypothetical protein [Pseudomonas hunanensis]|uniref:hypothetical protein n=1 Tax=Pseudomonas hunanensis TaxID=1247546 RepID=UPI00381B1EB5
MHLSTKDRTSLAELLTRTAENHALYAVLTVADGFSDISESADYSSQPGYRLIRVNHRLGEDRVKEFEIALLDDSEASIAYYAKINLLSIPEISSRLIAQHLVWRSASIRHSAALRDISRTVLFSYLVQDYDVLLAEDSITGDGRFYWSRQVSRAIELDLRVYAYDLTTQTLQAISTQQALNGVQDQAWSGVSPKIARALIS